MKRIQLFEFEDFAWFPAPIRNAMTNLIVVLSKMTGAPAVIASLIENTRKSFPFDQIIDMGSGSGGVMPMVVQELNQQDSSKPLNLRLTDLYPNPEFIEEINRKKLPHIQYSQQSTDATDLSKVESGLKTMMNSFHHMPPDKARQILHSAQQHQQPILIYEMSENRIPTIVWWLLLPLSLTILALMTLFMTPFSRPLSWQQLVFTYLIPIIPICYAWDGQASMVRMYTYEDIQHLLPPPTSDYRWEIAPATKADGKKLGYYIQGLPVGV
ncbi:MAG: hypothetical protein AAFP02_00705 [Bacteroidota bacterium]